LGLEFKFNSTKLKTQPQQCHNHVQHAREFVAFALLAVVCAGGLVGIARVISSLYTRGAARKQKVT
jgi:hypothetical protein